MRVIEHPCDSSDDTGNPLHRRPKPRHLGVQRLDRGGEVGGGGSDCGVGVPDRAGDRLGRGTPYVAVGGVRPRPRRRSLTQSTGFIGGDDAGAKAEMKRVLDDIQTGKFARDWMLENKVNQASFKATRRRLSEHPIEEVGEKLRAMMPWIKKNALVDKAKN